MTTHCDNISNGKNLFLAGLILIVISQIAFAITSLVLFTVSLRLLSQGSRTAKLNNESDQDSSADSSKGRNILHDNTRKTANITAKTTSGVSSYVNISEKQNIKYAEDVLDENNSSSILSPQDSMTMLEGIKDAPTRRRTAGFLNSMDESVTDKDSRGEDVGNLGPDEIMVVKDPSAEYLKQEHAHNMSHAVARGHDGEIHDADDVPFWQVESIDDKEPGMYIQHVLNDNKAATGVIQDLDELVRSSSYREAISHSSSFRELFFVSRRL